MSIIPVRDEPHWHELRLCHIGGSDVAALFGMSKFSSKWQVWMEKAGKLPSEDLSDNKNVQAGKFLEVGIANWAASKWRMNISKVNEYHVCDTVIGMGATLDYATDDGIPVEIKWSARGFGWEYNEDAIIHAPEQYLLQCQHQMACFGGEYAWLVALIDNEPRRMKVPRNEDIIDAIKSACVEFWFSIEKQTPPDPDFNMDAEAIAAFVGQSPITDVTLDDSHVDMFKAYLAAAADVKEAEGRKEAAKAELLLFSNAIMADRNTSSDKAVVRCGDHKISITRVAENLGKEVTPDMVGTKIGGRKGYVTTRIT
jgi:putative phage-type endonuclease